MEFLIILFCVAMVGAMGAVLGKGKRGWLYGWKNVIGAIFWEGKVSSEPPAKRLMFFLGGVGAVILTLVDYDFWTGNNPFNAVLTFLVIWVVFWGLLLLPFVLRRLSQRFLLDDSLEQQPPDSLEQQPPG